MNALFVGLILTVIGLTIVEPKLLKFEGCENVYGNFLWRSNGLGKITEYFVVWGDLKAIESPLRGVKRSFLAFYRYPFFEFAASKTKLTDLCPSDYGENLRPLILLLSFTNKNYVIILLFMTIKEKYTLFYYVFFIHQSAITLSL